MATESDRVAVQTYVPAEQRTVWRQEAEDLDMSQAEYVRTMVQAGRRGFDLNSTDETLYTDSTNAVEQEISDASPGVEELNRRVLDVLRGAEFADWETILAGVTDDIEDRLEETLDELQSKNRIRYSGRHGGYTVIDDER
jgi:hypothetical protein